MFSTLIAGLTTLLTLAGFAYYLIALWSARAFLRRPRFPAPDFAPPVSILKPIYGVDPGMSEAFASHCRQNYSGPYEILFGVSSLDDPACAIVRQLQADFPDRAIQLILCPDVLGPNGKVSNLAQLAQHARYDDLIINDSDIHVGPQLPHPHPRALRAQPSPSRPSASSPRSIAASPIKPSARRWKPSASPPISPPASSRRASSTAASTSASVPPSPSPAPHSMPPSLRPAVSFPSPNISPTTTSSARASQPLVSASSSVMKSSRPLSTLESLRLPRITSCVGLAPCARRAAAATPAWSFPIGLAWAFLNLIASGLSLPAFALFTLALLFRVSLALGVGVGILRDRQVLRDLWLLLPRDLLALAVWAWSYASDAISWRDQRFLLKKGKLVRLGSKETPTTTEPVSAKL